MHTNVFSDRKLLREEMVLLGTLVTCDGLLLVSDAGCGGEQEFKG